MRSMILPLMLVVFTACQPATMELTEAQRAAIQDTVVQIMDDLLDAGRALDAERIQAAYAENPVIAFNGHIIEDFDAHIEMTKQFLGTLSAAEGYYDNLHLEVLAPNAVAVTRNDHLSWTDTRGMAGQWHSAWTGVFRRINGEWKIVYAHESTQPESM